MIRIKRFVIERAVYLTTSLLEDFPRYCTKHCFHDLFPAFQYDIIDRIPELLRFVYIPRVNNFCQCLFYF